jgi:hypothetical protein
MFKNNDPFIYLHITYQELLDPNIFNCSMKVQPDNISEQPYMTFLLARIDDVYLNDTLQ